SAVWNECSTRSSSARSSGSMTCIAGTRPHDCSRCSGSASWASSARTAPSSYECWRWPVTRQRWPCSVVPAEPTNPINPLAVLAEVADQQPLGWVPDLLTERVHRTMSARTPELRVHRVNDDDSPPNLRLSVELSGKLPVGYLPVLRSWLGHTGLTVLPGASPFWRTTVDQLLARHRDGVGDYQ